MPNSENAVDPATPDPTVAAPAGRATPSPADTCREVERTQGREPGDRVKCAHLFGNYYRCNWWSRVGLDRPAPGSDWAAHLNEHVRKSRFLKVTVTAGRLTVEEAPEGTGRRAIV